MSDDDHKQQIAFLLNDAQAASHDQDLDTQMFSLLQIFKLSEQHNGDKTPSSAQVQMIIDLMRELNVTPDQIKLAMEAIYRRFGEEPPKP